MATIMSKKISKKDINSAALKAAGRGVNLDAAKVAPASIQRSKKVYTRKRKHKNNYDY